jgi:hypothetical protein
MIAMIETKPLICDGCGQPASPAHIAKRLQRLEWTTRFRPVHIGTVLLGSFSPLDETHFLYAPGGPFAGEAGMALAATGISTVGKSWEAIVTEFQRGGFLLTHVLECPVDRTASGAGTDTPALLRSRFPALLARIRRSLRPKRIVLISSALGPVLGPLAGSDLGCSLLFDRDRPFALDRDAPEAATARLRQALGVVVASTR